MRASLGSTRPVNGFANFRLPCKKLVVEYCEVWGSNDGMRRFIAGEGQGIAKFARENPGVEFIVKKRPFKHPLLRGLYRECTLSELEEDCCLLLSLVYYSVNNRDKVICVRNMEPAEIAQKLKLLLDSSGDKLKLEKGHPVKSTTESVRGKNIVLAFSIITTMAH